MWSYKFVNSGDELRHYGILGMKWGVRRFQNKDGSLTPAGKRRIAEHNSPNKETDAERRKRVIASRSSQELYKNADAFDYQELKAQYERLKLEKEIKNLNPVLVKDGEYYMKKAVDMSSKIADISKSASSVAASYSVIRKVFNGETVAQAGKK